MTKPLSGRTALITGANQGLGLAIARAYVEAGASVMMCARDADRLDRARAEVASLASPGQTVRARPTDVSRVSMRCVLLTQRVEHLSLGLMTKSGGDRGQFMAV